MILREDVRHREDRAWSPGACDLERSWRSAGVNQKTQREETGGRKTVRCPGNPAERPVMRRAWSAAW